MRPQPEELCRPLALAEGGCWTSKRLVHCALLPFHGVVCDYAAVTLHLALTWLLLCPVSYLPLVCLLRPGLLLPWRLKSQQQPEPAP